MPPSCLPWGNAVLYITLQVVPDADRDEGLPQQLQVLRQIYIPEIGYLLHSVLHDSVLYKNVRMSTLELWLDLTDHHLCSSVSTDQ